MTLQESPQYISNMGLDFSWNRELWVLYLHVLITIMAFLKTHLGHYGQLDYCTKKCTVVLLEYLKTSEVCTYSITNIVDLKSFRKLFFQLFILRRKALF